MKRIPIVLVLVTIIGFPVRSQEIDRLEFYATPIAEILVAIGAATGNQIVPDSSVTGSTSYFVRETSFEAALTAFARHHDLFVTQDEDIYLVSQMQIVPENGLFSVNATSVSTRTLLTALFRTANEEFQLVSARNPTIGPIGFEGKNLPRLVALIAAQAGMEHELIDGIYHFWDRAEGAPGGHVVTEIVRPRHVSVTSVAELLSDSLTAGASVHADEPSGLIAVSGPAASVSRIATAIRSIDRPRPTIEYQLLIIEYRDATTTSLDSAIATGLTGPDSVQAFSGSVGPLLSLNFDVLSAFGYEFALDLAAQLESQSAAVVIDTTLQGVSGERVHFENGQVRRVWSTEHGSAGNHPVLREVRAGLETSVLGRVAEGNEVIMQVETSLSHFESTARDEANGPRSRERSVSTTARAGSGVPVSLSAYVEESSTTHESGPPLLARVPILKRLLGTRAEERSATELGIYLIPRIITTTRSITVDAALTQLFERHVEGQNEGE